MNNCVIFVTGGAGYIGSQTVKELAEAGFSPVVFDNLSTGHVEAIEGIQIVKGDLKDIESINNTLEKYKPDAVLHFAASIEVEESVKDPAKYYQNNIVNGLNLLLAMRSNNIKKIIFSSSAAAQNPANPYGMTKLMFEKILANYRSAYNIDSIALRYFNASGADPSGEIGQDYPSPTHLITRVLFTALGKYPEIEIFGTDYSTPDGTCVRDYIHVKDLAIAHILALKALNNSNHSIVFNLGTGRGYSVKQVIETAKKVTGVDIPIKISPRRVGDPAELIADSNLAKNELGFLPKYSDLETIIETAWKWHKNNPEGYLSS